MTRQHPVPVRRHDAAPAGEDTPPTGSRPDQSIDLLVMTAVAVATVVPVPFLMHVRDLTAGPREALAWVALVIACSAIYFRRTHPLAVALITLACSLAYYPLSELDGPMLVAFAVALYSLAAEGAVLAASLLSGSAFAGVLVTEVLTRFENVSPEALVLMTGWFIAVVALGALVDRYRAYRIGAVHAMAEAERRSATEERLRIARELHDVLGHNISLIKVQAGAALYKSERDPGYSPKEALEAINNTSQAVLRELRSTLGLLRQDDEKAPNHPVPGLAQLHSLVESARTLGVAVTVVTAGQAAELPATLDLAAYRIIQEALTNVAKHANSDQAKVSLVYGVDYLSITVEDDGVGGLPTSVSGIAGMRKRAEALGGALSAGPKDAGGFRVVAALPREERA